MRSNTIVLPSGETSSDSHVPSSVVKLVLRVGTIGSSVLGAVFFEVSAAAGCCATPAMGLHRPKARTSVSTRLARMRLSGLRGAVGSVLWLGNLGTPLKRQQDPL